MKAMTHVGITMAAMDWGYRFGPGASRLGIEVIRCRSLRRLLWRRCPGLLLVLGRSQALSQRPSSFGFAIHSNGFELVAARNDLKLDSSRNMSLRDAVPKLVVNVQVH